MWRRGRCDQLEMDGGASCVHLCMLFSILSLLSSAFSSLHFLQLSSSPAPFSSHPLLSCSPYLTANPSRSTPPNFISRTPRFLLLHPPLHLSSFFSCVARSTLIAPWPCSRLLPLPLQLLSRLPPRPPSPRTVVPAPGLRTASPGSSEPPPPPPLLQQPLLDLLCPCRPRRPRRLLHLRVRTVTAIREICPGSRWLLAVLLIRVVRILPSPSCRVLPAEFCLRVKDFKKKKDMD